MPPPIQLFLTTIVSQPKLRQRQEYILRILQVKKIPYISYDLASDENAKRLWRRKAPPGNQDLPGILVGGKFPGTFDKFEEAVEYNELNLFLRLDEDWDEAIDGKTLEAQPAIGVPGVVTPEKITGQKPSFAPAGSVPIPAVREGEVDLGEVLEGYGLQGVKITPDEITDLVQMLGLNDEESKDLIGGLDFSVPKPATPSTTDTAPSSHPGQKSHSSTPSKRPPTSIDTSAPAVEDSEHQLVQESDEENDGEEGDDSGLDEPPDPTLPRLIRKRTDRRPLQSPLTPSSSSSPYVNVAGRKVSSIPTPSPKK